MNVSLSEKLKKPALIGAGVLAAAWLPLFLVAPGSITKRQKAPFYGRSFAHRGLHVEDKSVPENSLEAFRLAASAGYGVELDVQLSRDGQVVVFTALVKNIKAHKVENVVGLEALDGD